VAAAAVVRLVVGARGDRDVLQVSPCRLVVGVPSTTVVSNV
jgi:hypothetical protein